MTNKQTTDAIRMVGVEEIVTEQGDYNPGVVAFFPNGYCGTGIQCITTESKEQATALCCIAREAILADRKRCWEVTREDNDALKVAVNMSKADATGLRKQVVVLEAKCEGLEGVVRTEYLRGVADGSPEIDKGKGERQSGYESAAAENDREEFRRDLSVKTLHILLGLGCKDTPEELASSVMEYVDALVAALNAKPGAIATEQMPFGTNCVTVARNGEVSSHKLVPYMETPGELFNKKGDSVPGVGVMQYPKGTIVVAVEVGAKGGESK